MYNINFILFYLFIIIKKVYPQPKTNGMDFKSFTIQLLKTVYGCLKIGANLQM